MVAILPNGHRPIDGKHFTGDRIHWWSVASLGLVSPGAATNGVIYFSYKKLATFFPLCKLMPFSICRLVATPTFRHRSFSVLSKFSHTKIVSFWCHTGWSASCPRPALVTPLLVIYNLICFIVLLACLVTTKVTHLKRWRLKMDHYWASGWPLQSKILHTPLIICDALTNTHCHRQWLEICVACIRVVM